MRNVANKSPVINKTKSQNRHPMFSPPCSAIVSHIARRAEGVFPGVEYFIFNALSDGCYCALQSQEVIGGAESEEVLSTADMMNVNTIISRDRNIAVSRTVLFILLLSM